MSLSAFMVETKSNETIEYVASDRFVGEDGHPEKWIIRGISSAQDEELRKACTKRVQMPGKRNMYQRETDFDQYLGKLAVACTAYPNLNDASLQDHYGVMGADLLLKTMLKPGEYAEYLIKVQEINEFDMDFGQEVEEAKNL